MREVFEEIREQIHELRNLVGPFDLKLSNLDHQIAVSRTFFEEKAAALESKVQATSFRVDQHDGKIADLMTGQEDLSERIKRLELTLNIPVKAGKSKAAPVHEDKAAPDILPPQSPAL